MSKICPTLASTSPLISSTYWYVVRLTLRCAPRSSSFTDSTWKGLSAGSTRVKFVGFVTVLLPVETNT